MLAGKDGKKEKGAATPKEKVTAKKDGTGVVGGPGNSFAPLTGTADPDGEDDNEEVMIPLTAMQAMVTEQVQAILARMHVQNSASSAATQPARYRDLPALDKLRNFKGETDTDELDLWLKELKRHCEYYAIGGSLDTDEKKLAYATSHLVGGAEAWWETQRATIRNYTGFIGAISKRFRSAVDSDKAAEELYDLRQKEGQSVTAFSDKFMQLLTRTPNMHEEDRIRHFKRGLLPQLQQKVKEHQLPTLNEVVQLAIRLEATFSTKRPKEINTNLGKSGLNAIETEEELELAQRMQLFLNQVKGWKPKGPGTYTLPLGVTSERCWKCGDAAHSTDKCSYTTNVCYYCKKPGHIKMECKALKARQDKDRQQKGEKEGSKNQ